MTTPHELLPQLPIPVSGACRVRVRYCECDPMGVAHHAAYIPWLEIARTEVLRESGVSYAQLEAAGVLLVVVKLEVRYRAPIRYDDMIEIRTRVAGTSRVKIEHEYELFRMSEVKHAGSLPSGGGPGGGASGGGASGSGVSGGGNGGVALGGGVSGVGDSGASVLAAARTTLACVGRDGRPRELPAWLQTR
ncbi:MAG: acyl-CoA thioesterase [Planctomycetota bacterium]|nr:acyl-CoA thioesterase [Planctomycetota bacterium]